MDLLYDHQFSEILEKHAPYNNTHIPINEVNQGYIIANRNKNQPNHHFKSTSTMVYNKEELVNERLNNNSNNFNNSHYNNRNDYSSLAKVGKSLVGDTKFIPIEGKVLDSQSFNSGNNQGSQGNFGYQGGSQLGSQANFGVQGGSQANLYEDNYNNNQQTFSEKRNNKGGNKIHDSTSNFVEINNNDNSQNQIPYRNSDKYSEKGDLSTDELYNKLDEITSINNKNRNLLPGKQNKAGIRNNYDNNNYNNNFNNNNYNNNYNANSNINVNPNLNNNMDFNYLNVNNIRDFEMDGIGVNKSKGDLKSERKEIDNLLQNFIDNNNDNNDNNNMDHNDYNMEDMEDMNNMDNMDNI